MTDGLPDGTPLAGRMGGLAAVLLLHAGLIYALATSRSERPAPAMPPIQVRIIAEPQAAPTLPDTPSLAPTPPDATPPPSEMPPPAAPPPEVPLPPLPEVAPAPPPEAPPVVAQPVMPEPPPPTPHPSVPLRPIPPRPLGPAALRPAAPQPAPPRSAPTLPASPSRVTAPPAAAIPQASAPAVPAVRSGPSRMASAGCDTPERSAASARMGETGTVTVAVTIGADGSVSQGVIASSSGSRRLDETALAAIGLCRFHPALVDGKPEASKSTVRYHFE